MRKFDFSNPEDWRFRAICYLEIPYSLEQEWFVADLVEEMAAVNANDYDVYWDYSNLAKNDAIPSDSRFSLKGTCDHCGAWFKYGAAYENSDGEIAVVGHICATNYLSLTGSEYANKRLREAVKRLKSRKKADANFADLPVEKQEWLNFDHYISENLKSSFRKYGDLSPAQWALAEKLPLDAKKAAEIKANEPGPVDIPVELFSGRNKFSGIILNTKWQDNAYGGTLKMLFRDKRGFKLWGSVPKSIRGERGDIVEFFAMIKGSDDDSAFGFFSRPSKARTTACPAS